MPFRNIWFCLALALLPCLASGQVVSQYEDPIDVTEAQAMEAVISHPVPVYSSMAKQLKLKGLVVISAFIDKSGAVSDTIVQLGNPILVDMVVDAVRKWKFRPFRDEHGKPAFAKATLKFNLSPGN